MVKHTTFSKSIRLAAGGTLAVMLLLGCGRERTRTDTATPNTPTNAGLASLTRENTAPTINAPPPDDFRPTREIVEQYAALYEQIWAHAEQSASGSASTQVWSPAPTDTPTTTVSSTPAEPAPGRAGDGTPVPGVSEEPAEPTRFSLAAFAKEPEASGEAVPVAVQTPPSVPTARNAEERKQQLLEELVGVLGELAMAGDGPGSAALALAGLESVRPDALSNLKKQGVLSEAEVASLDAARDLFRALSSSGSDGRGGIADPGEVAAVLDRIRRELDSRAGLRILRAELCTRVNGFGQYETFPANRFIAGRAQPVIVYAEVDRFGHRESIGPDGRPRYEIELSQRLELYHVADNLNTWNRAAEMDKTISRNLVRDYYLINQVTLPANLSIGKYHLKVVMRDLITGNMAETIIPIEIVAGSTPAGRRP
jgi:hypothetical protein